MKKRLLITLLIALIIFTTGCETKDELKNTNILTTIYPVEYLVSRLYEGSTITSVYPNDSNINEVELTDRQIKTYAKNSKIFVYNGLSDERDIAQNLYKKNKKLQVIDSSYGIKTKYGVEELWLNPNNYIMLASHIKDDLQTISNNKYTNEEIENNFKVLEEELAILDANLRNIGKKAAQEETNTLLVSYDTFEYLGDYGFNIINISNENNITPDIKNNIKDKTYQYILIKDKNDVPDYIQDLVDNYKVTLIEVPKIETLTDQQRKDKDNYITIMQDFINTLSDITQKK